MTRHKSRVARRSRHRARRGTRKQSGGNWLTDYLFSPKPADGAEAAAAPAAAPAAAVADAAAPLTPDGEEKKTFLGFLKFWGGGRKKSRKTRHRRRRRSPRRHRK
jgi:hypothetical protein